MEKLVDDDFETLDKCPWKGDSKENFTLLYKDSMNCKIVRCEKCGVVFAQRRLNKSGLAKYWAEYLSRVHINDAEAVEKRNKMYEIDYEAIHKYVKSGKVLDVGCGNGSFLKIFEENGYEASGVEFGKEAATVAEEEHNVFYGEFPQLALQEKYDLIIFRGVLQYIPKPLEYLDKAVSLLNSTGCIFITAQPNMDSFCFKLFKGKFTQPVTGVDFIGYTERMFTNYFQKRKMEKEAEYYFYENTPYADIENDIVCVSHAIELKRQGCDIDVKAPAFWGNMISLVYRKT